MRNVFILIILFCLLGCTSSDQISPDKKLFLTAKVWGFLKYYHPQVNEGKFNWDEQLTEITSKLPDVKTEKELSNLLLNWIELLGEVAPCTNCNTSTDKEYFYKNFNLDWLTSQSFSKQLQDKLKYIEENRAQHQHYIELEYASTLFPNEPVYKAEQWNDENIRLITLFKYWNVIEYFYPYKYVMDEKWDDVLLEMIPRFQNIQTEEEYHVLIHELAVKLCDSHAFFFTEQVRSFSGNKYIASRFKIIGDRAVLTEFYDDSLARLDDLQIGDAVLKVDDEPVLDIFNRNEKYINGSNDAVKKMSYSFRWIFNGNTDSVRITFERVGKISTKTIRRYNRSEFNSQDPDVPKWKIMDNNIGYVFLEEDVVMEEDLPKMMKELANTSAIIFDIRTYPPFLWHELLGYLNAEPTVSAKYTVPDLTYPGRFFFQMADTSGWKNPSPYKGRITILMNEETQSRAESFVMALQSVKGAITVGRQTSGADGDVADFIFFDDEFSWITGRGVYYPDGRETQRIGIVPDVPVALTIEDIRNGRDATLEKALEVLKTTSLENP